MKLDREAQLSDLVQRVLDALQDSSDGKDVNPYLFFSHAKLSNWIEDAQQTLKGSSK
jgi:hypothetical protein